MMQNPFFQIRDPQVMMSKLRMELLAKAPFFGALAMRLQPVQDQSIPYMATDGESLFYNPQQVLDGVRSQSVGVVVHELLHVLLGHHQRRQGRAAKKWNDACDYAVNPIVLEAGFDLPRGALVSELYRGLMAEEIYAAMPEPEGGGGEGDQGQPQQGQQPGQGQPQPGQGQPQPGQGQGQPQPGQGQGQPQPGQGQPDQQQQEAPNSDWGQVRDRPKESSVNSAQEAWKAAASQLEKSGKNAGNLPAGLKRLLDEMLRPKASWQQLLRQFMTSVARDDFSWARPNRRYLSQGIYMPEARSEAMGYMLLSIDSSGSINREALQRMTTEINSIREEVECEKLIVVACDTRLYPICELESGEPLKIDHVPGGGGTKFDPVFEHLGKYRGQVECMVYFTDLIVTSVPPDPGIPVLWARPGVPHRLAKVPPYGSILELG